MGDWEGITGPAHGHTGRRQPFEGGVIPAIAASGVRVQHRPHLNATAVGREDGLHHCLALQLELLEQQLLAGGGDQLNNGLATIIGHHQKALMGVAQSVSAARAARYLNFRWPLGFNVLRPQAKP